ncbi:hypothetical protein RchiOBHm_Chr2g0123851 [Rosa chinensis]|uniref:Uncharacterized protein n=1 Tax=Rosa chinensis TaxID=74649 RepID=A0A2P6RT75_ROSCH|nr:hypothetical protein RchiOBHm_Chr2g0123851 [Rosa chinensis]
MFIKNGNGGTRLRASTLPCHSSLRPKMTIWVFTALCFGLLPSLGLSNMHGYWRWHSYTCNICFVSNGWSKGSFSIYQIICCGSAFCSSPYPSFFYYKSLAHLE